MPILDHRGMPVKTSELTTEVATPSISGVRQPWFSSVANTLTPERLATLLASVDTMNDPIDYLTLAEEMEERDMHYSSVLRTRKLAVQRLKIQVEAPTDDAKDVEIADFIAGIVKLKRFKNLVAQQLDAIGKGFAVSEIIWDRSGKRWEPSDFIWRDPRHFMFDRETGREVLLRDAEDLANGVPLKPFKFVVHKPAVKMGLQIRAGLARLVAVGFMCKSYGIKDWMAFAEVFGMPLRVGKYDNAATPEQKAKLLTAVTNIGTDAAAIIPSSMVIEFVETTARTGGDSLFQGLADWWDSQVSKAVLGQTMTSDNGSSYSQANVHNEVREDIRDSDAEEVSFTLWRDVVKPLVDLNFGPRRESEYPTLQLLFETPEDLKMLSEALPPFINLGLKVEASVIRDKFGLPEPEADAELLGPQAAPAGSKDPEDDEDPEDPEDPDSGDDEESEDEDLRSELRSIKSMLATLCHPGAHNQKIHDLKGKGSGPVGVVKAAPDTAGNPYVSLTDEQRKVVDEAFGYAIDTAQTEDEADTVEKLHEEFKSGKMLGEAELFDVKKVMDDYKVAAADTEALVDAHTSEAVSNTIKGVLDSHAQNKLKALSEKGAKSAADKEFDAPFDSMTITPPPPDSSWKPPTKPNFGKSGTQAADFREQIFKQHNPKAGDKPPSDKELATQLAAKHGMTEDKALAYVKWYRNDMQKKGLLPPKPGSTVKPAASSTPKSPPPKDLSPSMKLAAQKWADIPESEVQATTSEVKKWHDSLSPAERAAWQFWKGSGYSSMRAVEENPNFATKSQDTVKKVAALKSALDRAPTFQGPLYRGMRNLREDQVREMVKVGGIVTQPAMSSWSPEPKTAHAFFSGGGASYGVMFRLPSNSGIAKTVDLGSESEALIGKGAQFKVTRVAKLIQNGSWNNKFVVDLEEL